MVQSAAVRAARRAWLTALVDRENVDFVVANTDIGAAIARSGAAVAFDIEVVFIALWALAFDDIVLGGFLGMVAFVGIMELSVLYAAKKGLLTWK